MANKFGGWQKKYLILYRISDILAFGIWTQNPQYLTVIEYLDIQAF